ncbi:MAG: NADH-quinone oxidoreductase subunit L [Coriobacteriia bacterium]|nr:NADH-quinone oxidoreductase subunit L [Coriobacteriia bacterium]
MSLSWPWLVSGGVSIPLEFGIDPLAAVMLAVIGVVTLCVVVFSIGYMKGERGLVRYFGVIALFALAMVMLVTARSLVGLFVGWELVGACSYLLIGFWYEKPSAAEAARKAFIVTRVGDAGLLLGMALLWREAGSLDIATLLGRPESLGSGVLVAATLLLFAGAAGKSAQFPLHTWLPDAMEGPTPVSALIHAATMVAAGVFLVARMWPLFAAAPTTLSVVIAIGAFTALAAATVAMAQSDIKKVLAYSTISQLGFMFAALGAGAWVAALFHLVTHAAFKALLFLSSGSVIHGSGTQDLREMGGLSRKMPVTTVVWVVGGLALAGVPPLAGFFSKDAVIASVLHASPLAGVALVLASVLTGAYVARATRLAFFGEYRGTSHPHESPAVMTGPLLVLAVLAAVLGLAATAFGTFLGAEHEAISIPVAVVSVLAAGLGIAMGWIVWSRDAVAEQYFAPALRRVWEAARTGYGLDTLLDRVVVRPVAAVARLAYGFVDGVAIDGVVEGTASAASGLGGLLARLSNGEIGWYGTLMGLGTVLVIAATIWLAR